MATLLALDGNSLFHRAYHAYAPRDGGAVTLDRKGRKAWGVLGFMTLLGGIIERTKPDAIVIGFDDKERSLRREKYPAYKEGRAERDIELSLQMERTISLIQDLGLSVIIAPGLEADDVVASAAKKAEAEGWRTIIATSDRDSFALISEQTTVMRLVNGGLNEAVRMTPAVLFEKVGVRGEQYLDYAAMRGDKSDNLPGVEGIGEKTAAKLLSHYGTVQAAWDADSEALSAVIGKAASNRILSTIGRDNFKLSKDLMTLHLDVDLKDSFTRGAQHSLDEVEKIFNRHQVSPVIKLARLISKNEPVKARAVPARDDTAVQATTPEFENEPQGERAPRPAVYHVPNPRPERSLLNR